jgi:hypothetical protein
LTAPAGFATPDGQRLTGSGQIFPMGMYHPHHPRADGAERIGRIDRQYALD